jgi:MYXO-CTERM domain-containing protein
MQEYPAMLQTLLGAGYNVSNFGDCCASVISGYTTSETHPFITGNQFAPSISFAPDIVIIGSWGRHDWGMSAQNALAAFKAGDTTTTFTKFQTDYDTLVSKYIAAASKPKIFCSTPIPIPFGNDGPDDGYMTSPAATAIKAVCQKYNLPVIDLFTAFTGHKEYYINPPDKDSDGEHSSPAGATEIAQLVYDAITGADAGVTISPGGGGDASVTGPDDDAGAGPGSSGAGGGTTGASGTSPTSDDDSGVGGATGSTSGSVGGSSGTATTGTGGGTTGAQSGDTTSGASGAGTSGAGTGGVDTSGAGASGTGTNGGGGANGDTSSSGGGCAVTSSGAGQKTPWTFYVLGAVGIALASRRRQGNRRRGDVKTLAK